MTYQVLARKWRPQNFTQLVGQEHVSQSLCNALQHDRLHHAYLFTGTRGVGKTTVARILAKAMNCENLKDFNPCGECHVCQAFAEERFLDLVEVDAASRTKVEDTRDLLDNVQYAPNQGKYKVYLIDEVHMLSGHSFNALLKTLEEPPPHVKFLLATTNPQKIPVTVLSRCLQFNLKRLSPEQIDKQMAYILEQEKISFESEALKLLSHVADGSLRDGLSLLDQAIAFGAGEVKLETITGMLGTVAQQPVDEILLALANNQALELMQKIAEIAELTTDFSYILQQILRVLHRVSLTKAIPDFIDNNLDSSVITLLANQLSAEDIQLFYQIALIGQADLDLAPDSRSGFEMVMLRMLTFKPANEMSKTESPPTLNNKVKQSSVQAVKTVSANKPENSKPSLTTAKENQWAEIVVAMKIRGMARELANNCVLESIDEKNCHLILDAKHTQLLNPRIEEKLQQALQKVNGDSIKLNIKTATSSQTSPAQQLTQQNKAKQKKATEAINSDETVLLLKEHFDARVMPDTIKSV